MVKSSKDQWMSDGYEGLMHKARRAIMSKTDNYQINLVGGQCPLHMESDLPRKYYWLVLQNEVNLMKLDGFALVDQKTRGRESRNENVKEQSWIRGYDFRNAQAKWKAKSAVYEEMEKKSG